jgi:anti-sigma factor RsiW
MADRNEISSEEKADLVAFLDGEADPGLADKLEERIAHSPRVREEARALQESFALLEFLPMPKTSKDFTRRTAVFVAHGSKEKSARPTAEFSPRLRAAAYAAGLVLAFLAGWLAVAAIPDPNRTLMEDLPVIERLQEYRASREIEFLRALRDQQILDKADTNRLPDSPANGDPGRPPRPPGEGGRP